MVAGKTATVFEDCCEQMWWCLSLGRFVFADSQEEVLGPFFQRGLDGQVLRVLPGPKRDALVDMIESRCAAKVRVIMRTNADCGSSWRCGGSPIVLQIQRQRQSSISELIGLEKVQPRIHPHSKTQNTEPIRIQDGSYKARSCRRL